MIAAYQWLRAENRLTVRVLCWPEAQPYGLPWTAVPDDEQFAERLEQAAGMVQRTDDLLRVDGVTIGRGGPCGPGLILMRDPYVTPTAQRPQADRSSPADAPSARCTSHTSADCASTS
jgi:hypothetical protein